MQARMMRTRLQPRARQPHPARAVPRRNVLHSLALSLPGGRTMAAAAATAEAPAKAAGKPFDDAEVGETLQQSYGEVGRNPPSGRLAGVVMHPTSFDGAYGTGDLGRACYDFVDWLASAGMRAWQVLPLVPPDEEYFSPYSGQDALTGNPLLISLEDLVARGLLSQGDLPDAVPNEGQADFAAAAKCKLPLVRKAAEALLAGDAFASMRGDMDAFRRGNPWIEESALFDCLKRDPERDGEAWWDWEAKIKDRDEATLAALREERAGDMDVFVATQFLFDVQWQAVKKHANEQGVEIIGDMPIYVGGQSADVWAAQDLFELGPGGAPEQVSGVPPDAFSETGQLWGSPLYKWPAHEKEDFAWWTQRIGRAGQVYDQTRIDHFRAFAGYWAVPATEETAMNGVWRKGPGRILFDRVRAKLGAAAPFIMAEDLGVITPDVKELRRSIEAPGMVVLQFAWGGGPDNTHLPHNHYANSFAYPGTHDNETTVGWYNDSATNEEKIYIQQYLRSKGSDVAWDFIHEAMKSVSFTCMIMLQDVMRLDNAHRMNSPGRAEGNWGWRVPGGFSWRQLSKEAAELRSLAVQFDRAPAAKKSAGVSATVSDPLEAYCAEVPDADECRVYED